MKSSNEVLINAKKSASDECINWPGIKSRDGYGIVHKHGKLLKAHRLSYCIYRDAPIDSIAGEVIRHTCDNRACINPNHLLTGTSADNTADRHSRNRDAKGETGGMSKLTGFQVVEIRRDFVAWSRSTGSIPLAKKYGVSASTISQIIAGTIWKHVKQLEATS